jgi:hypothetical protein
MLPPSDVAADDFVVDFDSLDDELHTPEHPFCFRPWCACHEDGLLIVQVYFFVQDGLMTPEEATNFVKGRGI